jgi:hypothetical protein
VTVIQEVEKEAEMGVREVLHILVTRVPQVSQVVAELMHAAVERELGPAPAPEDPAVAAARLAQERAALQAQLDALGPAPVAPGFTQPVYQGQKVYL